MRVTAILILLAVASMPALPASGEDFPEARGGEWPMTSPDRNAIPVRTAKQQCSLTNCQKECRTIRRKCIARKVFDCDLTFGQCLDTCKDTCEQESRD